MPVVRSPYSAGSAPVTSETDAASRGLNPPFCPNSVAPSGSATPLMRYCRFPIWLRTWRPPTLEASCETPGACSSTCVSELFSAPGWFWIASLVISYVGAPVRGGTTTRSGASRRASTLTSSGRRDASVRSTATPSVADSVTMAVAVSKPSRSPTIA